MKHALTAFVAALALSACQPANEDGTSAMQPVEVSLSGSTNIFTDPGTGCQYLVFRMADGTATTPRMDVQGKQVCVTVGAE